MRVAYTLEQCWHRVPGGTAVSALKVVEQLAHRRDVEVVAVAGRHRRPPSPPWRPPVPVRALPVAAPWLYETWLRLGWPRVEQATGPVDVTHATTIVPCPTEARLVVTIHDLAFLHEPQYFTRHGVALFRRSLEHVRRHADLVLCPSRTTLEDCRAEGIGEDRLRVVPWGVDATSATPEDVAAVRQRLALPERFILFVGTLEPRKNLRGLVEACRRMTAPLPLVVAGASGWGDSGVGMNTPGVHFVGFVPSNELGALYAAADVLCYPSLREGYGLPVIEAMVQGTPVVTSRGTATEEAAGGAAVLVDPTDPDDIARGLLESLDRRVELSAAGRARAAELTWEGVAEATVAAYRDVTR